MTQAFWQRPKRHFIATDYVWFDNTPLGNSTLGKVMNRICQMAGLVENYTHHSIKPTYIGTIENLCREAMGQIIAPQRKLQAELASQVLSNRGGKNTSQSGPDGCGTASKYSVDEGFTKSASSPAPTDIKETDPATLGGY